MHRGKYMEKQFGIVQIFLVDDFANFDTAILPSPSHLVPKVGMIDAGARRMSLKRAQSSWATLPRNTKRLNWFLLPQATLVRLVIRA